MLDIYDAICISKIIHTHSIDHKIVTGTFFRTFCWVRLVKILKWSGTRTGNGSGSGSISGLESGQPVDQVWDQALGPIVVMGVLCQGLFNHS